MGVVKFCISVLNAGVVFMFLFVFEIYLYRGNALCLCLQYILLYSRQDHRLS
jgi:hypothetical protein